MDLTIYVTLTGELCGRISLTIMNAIGGNKVRAGSSLADRVPPHAFFVGSAIFHYLGPSFAVLLFARVPVAGVAWLRIVSAALVFAIWRRPWRAYVSASRSAQWTMLALGGVFAVMNYCFYRAIAELPLGTVAAIEFTGPVALALLGARSMRNLFALLLTVSGVLLLTEVRFGGSPQAFLWAFANAVLFALYIVLAHAVSRADPDTSPIDRLGASMMVAGLAISPLGWSDAMPALLDPVALGAGIAVGISSSVIPYVFDQLAMQRLPRSTYALFVALLPATAVIIGVVVLRQVPSLVEIGGVALVALGVALHRPPPERG